MSELIKNLPAAMLTAVNYPEIFIETRAAATEEKPASEVSLFHINEQYSLESSVSSGASITFEEGVLTISDAGNNNIYQYRFSPDEKWKKAKKSITKDKNITNGVTIYIRKKAKTSKSKGLTLPSTTKQFTVEITESAPKMTWKLNNNRVFERQ